MAINPQLIEISYTPDSTTLFERIRALPWAVFLDSCAPKSSLGRYDIMSASPYLTLETIGEHTKITQANDVTYSTEDPFLLLKKYLAPATPSSFPLPFTSGAIGFFSYDLARRIERLPSISQHDIHLPEMAIGLYDWAIIVDHQQQKSWLVSEGKDPQSATYLQDLKRLLTTTSTTTLQLFTINSNIQSNMTKAEYAEKFQKIQQYIRNGDCYQINLAQRFETTFSGCPWAAYQRLRTNNPAPFAAFMQYPQATILSLSPERFLQVQEGVVETKPIKGTRPRDLTNQKRDQQLAQELLYSQKDQAENLMIVDLLRNDLSKNCTVGSVKVPKLFHLESFPAVHHLVTTIHGQLTPHAHSTDLLRGCFPGGSITGAPKLRAMEIIEELEPQRRAIYCGAIGYINGNGDMDTNIAIRTLLQNGDKLFCSAGGGLIADSKMEDEYEETFAKVAIILKTLTT